MFEIKSVWKSFPFIMTTSVFAVIGFVNWWYFGPGSIVTTVGLFLISVALVADQHHKYLREGHRYDERLKARSAEITELKSQLAWSRLMRHNDTAEWFRRYMELRQDRAAFFKVLTAVLPAGYRRETYLVERPLALQAPAVSMEEVAAGKPVYGLWGMQPQLFLYFDLPAEYDLPHHQLRFVITERERQIIGDLPEYEKQRVTVFEADSEQTLRQYLATVAFEQLKEKEDGLATPATA